MKKRTDRWAASPMWLRLRTRLGWWLAVFSEIVVTPRLPLTGR